MDKYQSIIENTNTVEQLKELSKMHKGRIAFSTSFGIEDQVVSDMIFANHIEIEVFTLDTGRIFPETYKVWNETLKKYQKPIKAYFPNTQDTEKLLSEKGPGSFYLSVENRKECCNIRKVDPLKRALETVDLWITGLRSEQSAARGDLDFFEKDASFNLVKFNPLKDWSYSRLTDYVKANNVPYNELHDKGFVSIGCEPCTREINEGEDFRAGRWWWEASSKECGLHAARNSAEPIIKIKKYD